MTQTAKALDVVARRLIAAAEDDLRRCVAVRDLDSDLLGALYLSVLETLERQVTCDEAAIDDIALTIYLTVSAWQPNSAPPLQLLASLHKVIAVALAAQPFEIAPDAGAKRRYQ
jgi:hypothetical protein